MMNRKINLEYLKTILITLGLTLMLVFLCLGLIKYQVFNQMSLKESQEETIDYYLVNLLIEKNKYLVEKNPDNYKFHFKLGILYEVKGDFKDAEFEYKIAIKNAPLNEFRPKHKLALLYMRLNRLDEAQELFDNTEERPDAKLIECKVDVYTRLGDKYYNKADYETAQEEYTKAMFYAEKIKSPRLKEIKSGLASSYVYFAEDKVKNLKIDDAVSSLQSALEVINAPIIKYKLAVLLIKSNPQLALKYCDQVFNEEPGLINYNGYYEFLTSLANKAEKRGELARAELYRYKIKKLRDYYKSNILSVGDLVVEQPKGTIKYNRWTKKYNIDFRFILKNVSDYDVDSLIIQVDFKDVNGIITRYTKQVVDKRSILKAHSETPLIILKTFKKRTSEDTTPKIIGAEIYATKNEGSYRLLLDKNFMIEKIKKGKKAK